MSKHSSLYITLTCILCYSAAIASQPTIRAGSVSLNSGVKTSPNPIATASQNVSHGSALSKLSTTVIPKGPTYTNNNSNNNNNNNNSVSSAALDELQQQINDLRDAQQNQLTRSDVEDVVEEQVNALNASTSSTLTEMRSDIQNSIDTLQQQTDHFTNSINTDIDNRLKARGLMDENNNVSFVSANEVTADAIANKIARSSSAKTTISDSLEDNVKDIIKDDLKDHQILDDSGRLNVVKKGEEVQVTADTITNALDGSDRFKNLVSSAASEKGFVTETALNNKKFVSTDSDTFRNLASKSDVSADSLESKLRDKFATKGEVGTDEEAVKDLIVSDLKKRGIVSNDSNATLQVATKAEITADELESKLRDKFAAKGEVQPIDSQTIANALGDSTIITDAVDSALSKNTTFAKAVDVENTYAKASDITADALETKLQSKFAKKGEVQPIDSQTIANALGDSTIITDAVDSALSKNTTFARKIDVEKTYAKASDVPSIETVQTLQNRVSGGVNDRNSILYDIANNSDLQDLLKGNKGDKGDKGDPGDPGAPGTGIEYQDEVQNCDGLTAHVGAPQGHAWLNKQDGLLYISNGTSFPSCPNGGAPFKGDPGETAWHAYCDANWTNIVSKLYPNLSSCKDFTYAQYEALQGGAKAYCLYIAQNASKLDSASGLGLRLRKVLKDDNIVSKLKSTAVGTKINSTSTTFVDACEAHYNEIMEPETPWYSYCMEDNHLTNIITPLYPSITSCDDFTSDKYNAIMGGAKAYCLSLAKDLSVSKLDLTSGVGKKLSAKLTADDSSKTIEKLKGANLSTILSSRFNSGNTFIDACEARYNEIMSGNNAESVEMTYCKAAPEGDNFPSGTTNLDLIKKLYKTVQTCDDFTATMYAAITGGADAYCMSLTNNFQKVSLDDGVGLKITKLYMKKNNVTNLATAKTAMTNLQNKAPLARLTDTSFQGVSLLQACKDNYNDIMSGKDADNAWYAYCTENNRLETIIKPLYSDISTCDDFDSDKYAAIMGGAKAYCLSLTNNLIAGKVDFTTGIGKRLAAKLDGGSTTKLNSFKGKSLATVLNRSTSTYKFGNLDFVSACEQKYNEIMAGEDGQDGQDGNDGDDAATVWCKAHTISGNIVGTARLNPAKMMRMYEKNASVSNKITISSGKGYFTNLQACLDAVAADPSLMGGDSAADQDFDSKNTGFSKFDSSALSGFTTHRSGFIASLHGTNGTNGKDGVTYMPVINSGKLSWKNASTGEALSSFAPVNVIGPAGQNGTNGTNGKDGVTYMPVISKEGKLSWKNAKTNEALDGFEPVNVVGPAGKNGTNGKDGADGKTWRPTFSNGKISWTQSNDSSEISNFDVKATALTGVKEALGGSSSSDLTTLVNAKADARINAQASNLLTVQDLTNIINSGALQIGSNNKVTISSSATASNSSTSSSLNKLNGTDGANVSVSFSGSCTQQTCGGGYEAPLIRFDNP